MVNAQNDLTIKHILDLVKFKNGWELHLRYDDGRPYLQIQFDDIDNETGEEGYRAHCRKWMLSYHMTDSELVRTAYLAFQQAIMHEADEKFLFDGRAIYNPHIDVFEKWKVANLHDSRL
jgi:hypothetical protein